MPDYIQIQGGTVYDPANGIAGQVRDLWMANGLICEPPDPRTNSNIRKINAHGLVVMPGGVDMHCHVAGGKVNAGRLLTAHDARAFSADYHQGMPQSLGNFPRVPNTFLTGMRYAGMGYTMAIDAAIHPLGARHAHEEFQDTPCLDKACLLLVANHERVLQAIAERDANTLDHCLAWLLRASKGYGLKAVNPGGVVAWKSRQHPSVSGIHDTVQAYGITPAEILIALTQAVDRLDLPHPLHIHANHLGMPGNGQTTLESMQAVNGARAHFTHIQFHSYSGGNAEETTLGSDVPRLAEYVNTHPNLSVDVGQVLFGKTVSMTGDSPVGYFLQNLYKTAWHSLDVELESGCGVSPLEYRNQSLVHSWQWAIGLEWYLLVKNPWQIALSTDHPNGASFVAYPRIVKLLMDQGYRESQLAEVHPTVRERSALRDLTREYTLEEIAIITRAAPARMLGLTGKGHLGMGADADVTLYSPHADKELMFSAPRFVFKGGTCLVEQGELRAEVPGKTLFVQPPLETVDAAPLEAWFNQHASLAAHNFAFTPAEALHAQFEEAPRRTGDKSPSARLKV